MSFNAAKTAICAGTNSVAFCSFWRFLTVFFLIAVVCSNFLFGSTANAFAALKTNESSDTENDAEAAETTALVSVNAVVKNNAELLSFDFAALQVTAELVNNSQKQTAPGQLALFLDSSALNEPAEFIADYTDSTALLQQREVPALTPGETREIDFQVSRETLQNLFAKSRTAIADAQLEENSEIQPGTYRLQLVYAQNNTAPVAQKEISSARAEALKTSNKQYFSWQSIMFTLGPATQAANASVLVPITLPQQIETLPTLEELATLFAPNSQLNTLLEEATEIQAAIAIDPRIYIGVRAYGEAAPAAAKNFINAIAQSKLTIYVLPYADADPALTAEISAEGLKPTGVSFTSSQGIFTHESSQNDTENSTEDSTENTTESNAENSPAEANNSTAAENQTSTAPDFDALNKLENGQNALWFGKAATAKALKDTQEQTIIIGTEQTSATTSGLYSLNSQATLVSESILDDAANSVSTCETTLSCMATQDTLQQLLKLQALKNTQTDNTDSAESEIQEQADTVNTNQTVFFTLSRNASTAQHNIDILRTLKNSDSITLVPFKQTLKNWQSAPGGTIDLAASKPTEEIITAAKKTVEREKTVLNAQAALEEPQLLTDYQRSRILHLFNTANTYDQEIFAAQSSKFLKTDRQLIKPIKFIAPAQTQIFGTSANLPVQLHNALPFSAKIKVTAAASSAAITVAENDLGVHNLAAGETITVLVPLTSRVSTGESGLILTVTDLKDLSTITTESLNLTLSSRVETVALVLLSSCATALFGFGLWRSIRRKRQRTSDSK